MPEGDALRRAAERLQVLVGQRIEAEAPHPRAQATGVAPRIDGRVLESVTAVGKNLLLRFEGDVVVRSHLRMSGRWRVEPRGTERRGRPWLVLRGDELEGVLWNGPVLSLDPRGAGRLGPDVLAEELDYAEVVTRLRAADGRPLGEALQDQRLVAGIGNMWMAEALWEAEVSPWARVGELPSETLAEAVRSARRLMQASLDGGRRRPRKVYRRAGRPCPRCGGTVRSRGQGDHNRRAYWCPSCQGGGAEPAS